MAADLVMSLKRQSDGQTMAVNPNAVMRFEPVEGDMATTAACVAVFVNGEKIPVHDSVATNATAWHTAKTGS